MTYRPRIKVVHRPVRIGTGRIRIGGDVDGLNVDVVDPDGVCWALFRLLDGTLTVDQVVAGLVRRFPHVDAEDVRAGIAHLASAGYVENAAETAPDELSERELERYWAGRSYWRWVDLTPDRPSWLVQVLLKRARVVVVGLGGVGCAAALALVQSGVGHVHCVDDDVVELSNLNRQGLFIEADEGRPKAEVAVERLRAHNSDVRITGERLTIDGPAAVMSVSPGFDVVVLAADRPSEIRSWTNEACLATGTAWVHGGYDGPEVGVGLYLPQAGPCYECGRAEDQARRLSLPVRAPWPLAAGLVTPHAVNAVTAGIAGLLTAHAAMRLITGAPALRTNCQYRYNLATLLDAYVVGPEEPSALCRFCSPAT